jgi:hypothetical protein
MYPLADYTTYKPFSFLHRWLAVTSFELPLQNNNFENLGTQVFRYRGLFFLRLALYEFLATAILASFRKVNKLLFLFCCMCAVILLYGFL